MSKCILCGSNTHVIENYTPDDYVKGYMHHYGEAPKSLFNDSYSMRICEKCQLVFADPLKAGSREYYEWVTKHDTYYTKDRWEWHRISDYLKKQENDKIRILEVGCGNGFFLDFIRENNPNVELIGVDMTKSSVDECISKGHKVFCGTLEEFLEANPEEKFDYVMSFHCLEHVFNPKQYVKEMLEVCSDSGLCINAIPYTALSKQPWWDVLNTPPHHMTRWNIDAIMELAKQLSCDVEIMADDSFDPYRESINMLKLLHWPVYKQPNRRLINQYIKVRYSNEFKQELIRNENRERVMCSSEIGGEPREIMVPWHVTMVFRKQKKGIAVH